MHSNTGFAFHNISFEPHSCKRTAYIKNGSLL